MAASSSVLKLVFKLGKSKVGGVQQGPQGGLRDKPGKPPDYYHTCYCLSGLSVSQHYKPEGVINPREHPDRLAKTDLLCNVVEDRLCAALIYFNATSTK